MSRQPGFGALFHPFLAANVPVRNAGTPHSAGTNPAIEMNAGEDWFPIEFCPKEIEASLGTYVVQQEVSVKNRICEVHHAFEDRAPELHRGKKG